MGQSSLWVVQYGEFFHFSGEVALLYISGCGLSLFVTFFDHMQYGVIKCNAASNFRKIYGQYAF
jgi:hypothetical protein